MARRTKKPAKANRQYWVNRTANEKQWMAQNLANDKAFDDKIQAHYDEALVAIQKDIDVNIANLASSNKTTLDEARKSVSQAYIKAYQIEAKRVVEEANELRAAHKVPTYADWSKEVNCRMRIYNATMRINRLEYLKSEIGLELVRAGYQVNDELRQKLSQDYTDELKRQASILSMTVKDSLWSSREVQKAIMAQTAGATFSQRLWQNQDALKARLDAVLSTGIIRGDNPREMARDLKDMVSKTVTNYRYVTERIARTESARVQFTAQKKSIKDNGYRYVKWFAEPSACSHCRDIADNDTEGLGIGVYKVDDCPDIPVHPNCRCSISAEFKKSEAE